MHYWYACINQSVQMGKKIKRHYCGSVSIVRTQVTMPHLVMKWEPEVTA